MLTPEDILNQVKQAASPEQLIDIAQGFGINLSDLDAQTLFDKLHDGTPITLDNWVEVVEGLNLESVGDIASLAKLSSVAELLGSFEVPSLLSKLPFFRG